jgi:hypothetical protein
MTSVNNTNLLQTKYDCDVCNYHTCKKKDYTKHLLTAKHKKNTTTTSNENTTTTSNENTTTTSNENTTTTSNENTTTTSNENTTTTSNENTLNDLNIPSSELKNIILEMINQRISFEVNKQLLEKDRMIMLLGPTIFELVELIRNQDGTSQEISTRFLSKEATSFIDNILENNDEQLSTIKADREQREQKAQDDAEDYALEVEKTATLLAMRIERDALEKNKNELTHKAPSLIRQFK